MLHRSRCAISALVSNTGIFFPTILIEDNDSTVAVAVVVAVDSASGKSVPLVPHASSPAVLAASTLSNTVSSTPVLPTSSFLILSLGPTIKSMVCFEHCDTITVMSSPVENNAGF